MKRKTKAFWIAILAWVVMLWAWTFVASTDLWDILSWTGPAIVAGTLLGLIAYSRTSGPPMSRRGKAALIGFLVPVVPASGIVLIAYFACAGGGYWMLMSMATLWSSSTSIL